MLRTRNRQQYLSLQIADVTLNLMTAASYAVPPVVEYPGSSVCAPPCPAPHCKHSLKILILGRFQTSLEEAPASFKALSQACSIFYGPSEMPWVFLTAAGADPVLMTRLRYSSVASANPCSWGCCATGASEQLLMAVLISHPCSVEHPSNVTGPHVQLIGPDEARTL
jgi:hypothetical protein